MRHDIFISYVEEDSAIAQELARSLEPEFSTWYYERDCLPGPEYLAQIPVAIDQSSVVAVVISRFSLKSTQVNAEIVTAFEAGKAFLPLLVGITHEEFRRRTVWRQAFGASTSLALPASGIAGVLPRILAGVRAMVALPGEQFKKPESSPHSSERLPGFLNLVAGTFPIGRAARILQKISRNIRLNPSTEEYLNVFRATNRCPSWDPELTAFDVVKRTRIQYAEAESSQPPAFTSALEAATYAATGSKIQCIPSFVERLLGWNHESRSRRKNVFVLLGDPGIGKSSFAVQIAEFLAQECSSGMNCPVPIYVNLHHFRDRVSQSDSSSSTLQEGSYSPTLRGLRELVQDAVFQGCPRYLLHSHPNPAGSMPSLADLKLQRPQTHNLFFIFDSMDEMPFQTERVRAIADFIDDPEWRGCIFLLTCRYYDFVKLADYTHNLQIQRFDLLPWTKPMVTDYLARAVGDDQQRKWVLKAIVQAHSGRRQSRILFYPLAVALAARLKHAGDLSSLWRRFVSRKLSEFELNPTTCEEIEKQLEALAFSRVVHARTEPELSPKFAELCTRAGLVRQTKEGISFEIRPLEHHFAARAILDQIRNRKSLPRGVRLEDINQREVLQAVSEQAGTDPVWLTVLVKTLATREGDMRTHGDRLVFVAHSLTAGQLRANPELRQVVARIAEFLVSAADDVEKERCLDALVQQPELLDPSLPSVRAFFAWVVLSGSKSAVLWLLKLFASNKALRLKFPRIWLNALVRCLNDATLGRHIQSVFQFQLERWLGSSFARVMSPFLTMARLAVLFVGQFGTYLAAWTAAVLLAQPVFGLFPKSPPLDLQSLWARQLDPSDLTFHFQRLYTLIVTFYLPRHYLMQQARAGIRFKKWWVRYVTLVGTVFGVRFGFFVVQVLLINLQMVWRMILYGYFAYLLYLAASVSIALYRNPSDWRQILRSVLWGKGLQKSADRPVLVPVLPGSGNGKSKGAVSAVTPSDLILPIVATNAEHVAAHYKRRRQILWRVITLCTSGGALAFVVVLAALFGVGIAIAALTVAIGLAALYAFVIQPVFQYRRTRASVRLTVRSGLSVNLELAFDAVLREISDVLHPDWVRCLYAELLNEVRYTHGLYSTLESFYRAFPNGKVKDVLTPIVGRAYHEFRKQQ